MSGRGSIYYRLSDVLYAAYRQGTFAEDVLVKSKVVKVNSLQWDIEGIAACMTARA